MGWIRKNLMVELLHKIILFIPMAQAHFHPSLYLDFSANYI